MPTINFSGIASGIDSEALIDATSEATRQQRVTPLEENVEELTDTNDALTEIKTKLTSFKTLLGDFTTINGGPILKQASSTNEAIVSATASNGANNGIIRGE